MMLFLIPTFPLVFSMCALDNNVKSSDTPKYTGYEQWASLTPFQLMFSYLVKIVALCPTGDKEYK